MILFKIWQQNRYSEKDWVGGLYREESSWSLEDSAKTMQRLWIVKNYVQIMSGKSWMPNKAF